MKSTLFDYLEWRGDLSFKVSPFNKIDNLIFSELVFLDYSNLIDAKNNKSITIKQGVDAFFTKNDFNTFKFGMIVPDTVKDLAKKVIDTKRFSNIKIIHYREEIIPEKYMQFCGAAFLLDDGTIVIAFEGTDDTIVGWRENFNLFIEPDTYAQIEAKNFTDEVARMFPNGRIYICGHSKGGNLAYYAGIFCDDSVKPRIAKIINNDGPGLIYSRYDQEKCKIIDEKGLSLLPNSSIVGRVFEQRGRIEIISSRVHNVFQHNPFDLLVKGTDFVPAQRFTTSSVRIKEEFNKLYASVSYEDAKLCIDELYNCITINDQRTLLDLKAKDYKVLRAMTKMDRKSKKIIHQMMAILINNNAWIK